MDGWALATWVWNVCSCRFNHEVVGALRSLLRIVYNEQEVAYVYMQLWSWWLGLQRKKERKEERKEERLCGTEECVEK